MRIIVPTVSERTDTVGRIHKLQPEVAASLRGRAEFIDVGESDSGYYRLLAEAWHHAASTHEDFCVIEPDMLLTAEDLKALEECPHQWCFCPYDGPPLPEGAVLPPDDAEPDRLGRYSWELTQAVPNLFEEAAEMTGFQTHWLGQDTGVSRVLRGKGFRPHAHKRIRHMAEYPHRGQNPYVAPPSRKALANFYEGGKRWPEPAWVQLTVALGSLVGELTVEERAHLFHKLALLEGDLQASLEALHTLRRVTATVDYAEAEGDEIPKPEELPQLLKEADTISTANVERAMEVLRRR